MSNFELLAYYHRPIKKNGNTLNRARVVHSLTPPIESFASLEIPGHRSPFFHAKAYILRVVFMMFRYARKLAAFDRRGDPGEIGHFLRLDL